MKRSNPTLVLAFAALSLVGCGAAPTIQPRHDLGGDGGGGFGFDFNGGAADLTGGISWDAPPAGTDLTLADDSGAGGDLAGAPDLLSPGKAPGEICMTNADCASGMCKAVLAGGDKVCVAPCMSNADCANYFNLYCAPTSAGSTSGYCVPRSPVHCASCAMDSDCGILAERCIQAPSDSQPACHIDCSLDTAACPSDYSCTSVPDGMNMRKLCVPKVGDCLSLSTLGGYCDRVGLPQPCWRANMTGKCTGQRQCMMVNKRYDICNAIAPQYKKCGDQDPAGCMLQYDPSMLNTKQNCGMCGHACGANQDCCGGMCADLTTPQNCGTCGKACANGQSCCGGGCTALNTAQNCGACGNACPGAGKATANVTCSDPTNKTCTFSCVGENYDVDKDPANGCERLHTTPPGHTMQDASNLGTKFCEDDLSLTNATDLLCSDARVHANPAVTAFDGNLGTAPDFWTVIGSGKSGKGSVCVNDYAFTFATSGGGNNQCYRCTIIVNGATRKSVTISGGGSGSASEGDFFKPSYPNNATINFLVEKICSLPIQEAVNYTLTFHL